jgi:hypothetical protein
MKKLSFNASWRTITKKTENGYSWEVNTVFPDIENMESIFKQRGLPFRYNKKGDFIAQVDCVKLAEEIFENQNELFA